MKSRQVFLFLLVLPTLLAAQGLEFKPRTTVGGYGELHYNANLSEDTHTMDFHRFVLFFSHAWNEKWSFNSEVELEHNFVSGGQGELELEQAYVDFHPHENWGVRAGVVLPSAGLINERHEPPTFLSVERPDYHKNIIPTTWFGNGAAIYFINDRFDAKFTIMEGLNGNGFSLKSGIRGGRQKGYKSDISKPLFNGRVDVIAVPGLRVGGSLSITDATYASGPHNRITLIELHGRMVKHHWHVTAEYGRIGFERGDAKAAQGFYADLGYDVGRFIARGSQTQIIPWVRYSRVNPVSTARMDALLESMYQSTKWLAGVAVKPVAQVILKVEYGQQTIDMNNVKTKLFNMGVGYWF